MTREYIALSTREEDGKYWLYWMKGSKLMFSDRCDGGAQFSQLLDLKQNLNSDKVSAIYFD